MTTDELLAQIAERRSEAAFMARLKEIVDEERDVLDRLAGRCACEHRCGDVLEEEDDAYAVCKGLPK